MRVDSVQSYELRIPFKAAFKHASAERTSTQTLWIEVKATDGLSGFGEGCPREYVTGESLQTAHVFVSAHRTEWLATILDLATLRHWIEQHQAEIDRNPAAWCAVELALLDLLGKTARQPIEALLELPELSGVRTYTAVLGSSSVTQFAAQLNYYLKSGFKDFKIKLTGDPARDGSMVRELIGAGVSPDKVRADANNLWPDADAALRALQSLDFPFFAVEEPLTVGNCDGLRALARTLGVRIILDESVLRPGQLEYFGADVQHWIVNVRISKMGGLIRTLNVLKEARRLGFAVVMGAHVGESSLLTRSALTAVMAAGDLVMAQEGGFGTHLLASDVVLQPLMFGPGGKLDLSALPLRREPGLGLSVLPQLPLYATAGG